MRILNWHEVVNDRFGERAVLVSYCPLCGTGMAFDARAASGVGSFGVSGLLYNSDVLLYDRATQSLWSQIMQHRDRRAAQRGAPAGAADQPHQLGRLARAATRARVVLRSDTGFVRDYARDPVRRIRQGCSS